MSVTTCFWWCCLFCQCAPCLPLVVLVDLAVLALPVVVVVALLLVPSILLLLLLLLVASDGLLLGQALPAGFCLLHQHQCPQEVGTLDTKGTGVAGLCCQLLKKWFPLPVFLLVFSADLSLVSTLPCDTSDSPPRSPPGDLGWNPDADAVAPLTAPAHVGVGVNNIVLPADERCEYTIVISRYEEEEGRAGGAREGWVELEYVDDCGFSTVYRGSRAHEAVESHCDYRRCAFRRRGIGTYQVGVASNYQRQPLLPQGVLLTPLGSS
jgi:hypothetical protein